ncbi:SpoIID/LytB domain-containing protein [Natroniella sulfidigena]|uniref:SpoIID/LytB domain-containing protein n=1 Tax=Natroniella sulfidigena TaxID=723921 RepID=UPI00200A4F3B|nr:SpoIID/LytB domain-containing protein [Natroniella sulfidigena]MCK8815965.1 SpoIID/LytB domain-containing protein [Natroniella sulfidigena]
MKIKVLVVLILLVVAISPANAEEKVIKIGLLDGVEEVKLEAESGFELLNADDKEKLLSQSRYEISREDDYLSKDGNNNFKKEQILFRTAESDDLIEVNGQKYRGDIEILNSAAGLIVINHVKMSDYLASVVGSEVISSWPTEVLKAQAIVARTYALRNLNKYQSRGYNLSNTVKCQVYRGVSAETERTIKAVAETKGQVITYDDQLISAVYHSTAGGKTANSSTVWNGGSPYLKSVVSNDELSPHYSWQEEYTKDELEDILRANGLEISKLKGISLKGVGPSGRAKEVIIHAKNDEYIVNNSQIRDWLELKSTNFSIIGENILEFNQFDDSFDFDFNFSWLDQEYNLTPKQRYLFKGYGWGHGVGMSQWGAYQMTVKEGANYREILKHYYTDVEIGENKEDSGGIADEG